MRMVNTDKTNVTNVEPIRVGIAGLGRSGWNIHARTMQGFPGQFRVEAVVDPDANRRREASDTLGCRAYDDLATPENEREIHTDHLRRARTLIEGPFAGVRAETYLARLGASGIEIVQVM